MSPRTALQFEELRNKSREKIILASMKLFAQKSFHNTTIENISKEAGISKGLIYNYFATKEDILKGIVEYLFQIGDKIMEESLSYADPKDELRSMISQIFQFLEQQSEISRIMIPLALELGNFNYINELMEHKTKGYRVKLMEILEALGYDNPEMEAWSLGAFFDGVSLNYAVLGKKFPAKKLQQYICKRYGL